MAIPWASGIHSKTVYSEQLSSILKRCRLITVFLRAVTPYAHASWAIPFIQRIPGLTDPSQILKMRMFGKNQTLRRLQSGAQRKDLFYHLVCCAPRSHAYDADLPQSDEEGSMKVPPSLPTMIADGLLAIIAGSDTTSTVLTSVIYFLLRHPEAHQRLQAELAENFLPDEEPTDPVRLSRMPWLNACMYVLHLSLS